MAAEAGTASKKLDYLFKFVLVGDLGVGKTSLLRRISTDDFVANPTQTSNLALDFKTRLLDIDGKKIKLQIWDTAGQERYSMRSITKAYFRGSSGVVVVYDITSPVSFDNGRQWLMFLQEHGLIDAAVMILGNKADLSEQREVPTEIGRQFARDYDATFMEVSAKTGDNVEMAFISFAKKIKDSKLLQKKEPCSLEFSESIVVEKQDSKQKTKCSFSCR